MQVELFSAEENVPGVHAAHARSVSVSPSEATEVPTTQVVLSMHGVAGFASSSQVPWAHAIGRETPPTHELPLTQAAQVGGVACVAGAIWYVPGAQARGGPH